MHINLRQKMGASWLAACPDPPNHILLSISDNGPGIPQEAQAHLFQAFYQAHRRPEIGTEGLGLGLSIVKQLVELHGATITVESTVGAGTTFHIRFPRTGARLRLLQRSEPSLPILHSTLLLLS